MESMESRKQPFPPVEHDPDGAEENCGDEAVLAVNGGYTRYPNFLIDHAIPHLNASEASVLSVVVFKTIGWNQTWDEISLSQFEEASGLSKPNVTTKIQNLIDYGLVARRESGNSHEYRVCRPDEWSVDFPGEVLPGELSTD